MLDAVEQAAVFGGYLEDLVYTPKSLKSIRAVQDGAVGEVTWVRARETHPGPHSAWFWDHRLTGGGAIVDLGCHCIEMGRCFVGKDNRPVEVMCHTDTLVHPIGARQRHRSRALRVGRHRPVRGQLDVPWRHGPARRGRRHARHHLDQPLPAHGPRDVHHRWRRRLRRREGRDDRGLALPVGDEVSELGYTDMFSDMFDSIDEGRQPMETLYDGYVVNAIMDACYRSAQSRAWEPVELRVARRVTGRASPSRPRCTTARSSSSARSCRMDATSSSSRIPRAATSATG